MPKLSGLLAYSSSSSPEKNLQPLSYSPKELSSSGISRYIYPTGRPSTVILSLAKHPPVSFQSVRRSFMSFAGIKKFFFFIYSLFLFAGNVICKNTRLVSFILITDTRQVCFLISNSCTLRIIQRIKRIGYARLMGTRHMKINARRLYIIVSQQFLYGSKVCPLFQ